jgi:hypothetical protein
MRRLGNWRFAIRNRLWPADGHGECPDQSPIGSDEGLSTRMRRRSARLSELVQHLLDVRPKTVQLITAWHSGPSYPTPDRHKRVSLLSLPVRTAAMCSS